MAWKFNPFTGSFDLINTPLTSTDQLPEGINNLYFTDLRVSNNNSVLANTAKVGITTQQSNDIISNNAKITASGSINTHSDVNIVTPVNNEVLTYNGTNWVNSVSAGGGLAVGNSVTGGTNGSIFYNNAGTFQEDNLKLHWDNINKRLGIGTSTPNNKIQIPGLLDFDDVKFNLKLGTSAGSGLTTGSRNTIFGRRALSSNSTGTNNVAIGDLCLLRFLGSSGLAIGSLALLNDVNTGTANMAIGTQSMQTNSIGQGNLAVGSFTLFGNVSGQFNVALGVSAMKANTTGSSNVSLGQSSMIKNTTGNFNFGLGSGALGNNLTGSANIFIGTNAGQFVLSSNNVGIGTNAGSSFTGGSVALGDNAAAGIVASNQLFIANSNTPKPLIHGEFINKNLGFSTTDYAGGIGVQAIANATTIPTLIPVGGGVLYSSGGGLYWKGSAGTITLIANA